MTDRQSRFVLGAAALTLALAGASAAAAQGVCVECNGPDRGYLCTIKDAEKVQFRGNRRAQEMLCITELARAGGHQSCRLNTSFSGPCIGHAHEIDLTKAAEDNVVVGRPPPQTEVKSAEKAPPRKGPPETLEELARETLGKSDEGMRKAGDAVGGAARKTWDCVFSLFQRCQ